MGGNNENVFRYTWEAIMKTFLDVGGNNEKGFRYVGGNNEKVLEQNKNWMIQQFDGSCQNESFLKMKLCIAIILKYPNNILLFLVICLGLYKNTHPHRQGQQKFWQWHFLKQLIPDQIKIRYQIIYIDFHSQKLTIPTIQNQCDGTTTWFSHLIKNFQCYSETTFFSQIKHTGDESKL